MSHPPSTTTLPSTPAAPRLPGRAAALIEQGLVSGASFGAFLLFARHLSPQAWGEFGLAYAVVLFMQGFQRAWVTIPMVAFTVGPGAWAAGRLSWARLNAGLAWASVALLAAAAGLVSVAGVAGPGADPWVQRALGLAACLCLPMFVHEFSRRAAVQEQRFDLLAVMGGVYAAVLLAAAWTLRATDAVGSWLPGGGPAVLPALGLFLASAAAAWVYRLQAALPVLPRPARRPGMARHAGYAGFVRWASLSHLGYSGYNFGVTALLAVLAGPAAVGVFHACRTLVQPVHTLIGAMDSIDKPRAAAALATQGAPGLRRVLWRAAAWLLVLGAPYLLLVVLGAEALLSLAYAGLYDGHAMVVSMWCLVALCTMCSQPVESGLYVARRTRRLFAGRAVAAAASLVVAVPLVQAHGAAGALAAMALGYALTALLGAWALRSQSLTGLPEPAAHATLQAPASDVRGGGSLYLAWTGFQRRPVSMAALAGFTCHFLPLAYKGRSHLWRALHYALLFWRTVRLLRRERPAVAWLQLPQMPLLWAALLTRALFNPRLKIVADCHNAVFKPPWSRVPGGLRWLPKCDLILVHNDSLLAPALALGLPPERTRVLEDVPPPRGEARPMPPVPAAFAGRPRPWVLFPGSYGVDEPVAEVLQAARQLPQGVVAVTGRTSNAARNGHDIAQVPVQAVLTGYLPLADFEALLLHCDVVLALTRFDGIQLSVCNEALGFGKPMVMSGTPLLRQLFGSGALAVDSRDPVALAAGIQRAWRHQPFWAHAADRLARQRRDEWLRVQWFDCQRVLQGSGR